MTHFVFLLMSLKLFLMMSELVTSLFLSTKSSTGSIKTNTDPHFIGPGLNKLSFQLTLMKGLIFDLLLTLSLDMDFVTGRG